MTCEAKMRRTPLVLHMLVYSMLWGGLIGGIAMAVSIYVVRGSGYSILFALVGIFQGLVAGSVTGVTAGLFIYQYYQGQTAAGYRLYMALHFALFFAFCFLLLSLLIVMRPLNRGEDYYDAMQALLGSVIWPSIILGLLV